MSKDCCLIGRNAGCNHGPPRAACWFSWLRLFPKLRLFRFSSDLTLFIAWAVFTTSITSLSPSWLFPHHRLFWRVQNTTEFYLHGLRSDASISYLGLGIAGIEGFSKDTLPIPLLLSVASTTSSPSSLLYPSTTLYRFLLHKHHDPTGEFLSKFSSIVIFRSLYGSSRENRFRKLDAGYVV